MKSYAIYVEVKLPERPDCDDPMHLWACDVSAQELPKRLANALEISDRVEICAEARSKE